MSTIADVTAPRLEPNPREKHVRVYLGIAQAHSLLISTREEARALIDVIGRAFGWLDEQDRLDADRLDREAGRATNAAFAAHNLTHRTFPQATPAPAVIQACTCNRYLLCPDHIQDSA